VYPRLEPPPLRLWLTDSALRLPVLSSRQIHARAASGSWEQVLLLSISVYSLY
jgi:hypothetical protein